MNKEIWKDIPGFEGRYQVSDKGRVKSLKFRGFTQLGEHVMKPAHNNGGYAVLRLCEKPYTVHSLVALAFLGERPKGYDINHKNGKPGDNRVENLEYCTRQENVIHARDVLGRQMGCQDWSARVHPRLGKPNHGAKKFSWECAQLIVKLYESHGMSKKALSRHFKCSVQTIRAILSYKIRAYMEPPPGCGRTGDEPVPDFTLAWDLPE